MFIMLGVMLNMFVFCSLLLKCLLENTDYSIRIRCGLVDDHLENKLLPKVLTKISS